MSVLDELLHELVDPSNLGWKAEAYSVERASSLNAADRATYVAKLMEKSEQGDKRAVLSLGYLPALEAVPMLMAASKNKVPWALTARRALVLLGSGYEVIDAIVHDALHAQSNMDRIAAIMDLKRLGGRQAMKAFDQALSDSDSTVRMLAWEGLVSSYDLERYMRDPAGQLAKGTTLELMHDFLAVDVKALNRIGAEETRAILMKLAGGASPESVGVAYTPDPAPEVTERVGIASVDEDVPYPVDEIAKLKGMTRRRAEALIASRLLRDDQRVPDALVRLDAVWTVPVLEELAQAPAVSPELRTKVLDAIRQLKANPARRDSIVL